MTTNEPKRESGYRGALSPRNDRLGRPWVITVIGVFVLIIVLSLLQIPSRFIPDPTPVPVPSTPAAPSESAEASPSGSVTPSGSAAPSGSAVPSVSPSLVESASPSP
jgi:hypothetical protein